MFILIFIIIVLVVYIKAFKDEFTAEHINKITPFLWLLVSIFGVMFVLGLMGFGGT